MSSSVVITENGSSTFINNTNNLLADIVGVIRVGERSIENVEDTLADLFNIDNIVLLAINGHDTDIVLLTTGGRIEERLIKNNDVTILDVLVVSEDFNNLSFEVELLLLVVEKILGFLDVGSLIENLLRRFGELHLSQFHFVVEIVRLEETSGFSNGIRRHTPRFDGDNPVIKGESFLLVEDIDDLLLLGLVGAVPLVEFDLDDVSE